ncbi:MAG: M28 family peptidase, partial [Chitinophagaceae bacterium]
MKRKIILVMAALLVVQPFLFGQNNNDTISEKEVVRIIHFLAADSLKGRGNGRPELLKAGAFIGEEFKKSGLKPLTGNAGYYIPFRPFGGSKKFAADALVWNGKKFSTDEFIYIHHQPGNYSPKQLSDFTVIKIDSFFTENILESYKHIESPLLLWSDQPQPDKENYFPPKIKMPVKGLDQDILMVCASDPPASVLLSGVENYYSNVQYNIVGLLPGKSKPNEVILFSAHYDHEGVFQRKRKKDSIMNGANDNASGVTALIMLAEYFATRNDNERTIVFCAFAGEELGLLGSKDFVQYIEPATIIAGINIEMIGIPQYGKNNVFITGYDHSTLPSILEKQFSQTPVKVKAG